MTPPLRYFGTGVGRALVSDGKRYAAYLVSDRSARVLDEHGLPLRDFEIPPGPLPLFRTVEAVGGGYALLGDSVGSVPRAKLVGIKTGTVIEPSLQPWAIAWDTVYLRGVGRNWLSGGGVSSHGGNDTFLNWHSGRVANDAPSYYEPRNTARAAVDLNRAELWRPLCSPLRRRSAFDPKTGEGDGVWRSYQYRPPFGLTTSVGGRLVLDRCGRRKTTVLSRCRGGCGFAQLGGGVVTWRDRRRAYFYRARTRCRRSWKLPAPASYLAAVAHTSARLFISTIAPQSVGVLEPRPLWKIFSAALPSC